MQAHVPWFLTDYYKPKALISFRLLSIELEPFKIIISIQSEVSSMYSWVFKNILYTLMYTSFF